MQNNNQQFPNSRLRRTRASSWSRALVSETRLSAFDLIWAIILKDGNDIREPIKAMPGIDRISIDHAVLAAKKAHSVGIPVLALFPYTSEQDRNSSASEALNPDNLMCRAARAIKQEVPEIGLMADVALDPYTNHGHDGFLEDNQIVNDKTVEALAQQALIQAQAGFDIVAPSDMMDGRVGAIRQVLEAKGLIDTQIMSYAAKYASAFYGPYREAIGSAGVLQGDKRTYQMDPANSDEALHEVALDISEGADSVIIKPAGAYLDIIRRVKDTFSYPTFGFQVSGEYAMIISAAQNGAINREAAILESLIAIKRAGADGILSYFALEAAILLQT